MSNTTLYKHFARIIELWPKDALRPTVSFQDAMQRRVNRRILGVIPPKETKSDNDKPTAPYKLDEEAELLQANALYTIIDERYSASFQAPDSYYKPKSNPEYYTNLVKEMDQAPNRSWWGRMRNKWKGSLRMS